METRNAYARFAKTFWRGRAGRNDCVWVIFKVVSSEIVPIPALYCCELCPSNVRLLGLKEHHWWQFEGKKPRLVMIQHLVFHREADHTVVIGYPMGVARPGIICRNPLIFYACKARPSPQVHTIEKIIDSPKLPVVYQPSNSASNSPRRHGAQALSIQCFYRPLL